MYTLETESGFKAQWHNLENAMKVARRIEDDPQSSNIVKVIDETGATVYES